MTLPETFAAQLAAYEAASTAEFRWRPLMMRAVLDVSPPSVIREAWSAVDSKCPPSDSTLRRMIARTREKMGLPELPVSEGKGRTPASFYDEYRATHCARWIRENGGHPRMEQLVDPNWDLRPWIFSLDAPAGSEPVKEIPRRVDGSDSDLPINGADAPDKPQASVAEISKNPQESSGEKKETRTAPSGNPFTQGIKLEDELRSLTIDADYPRKAWTLKLEIYKRFQKGQKAPFTERQDWKQEIRNKMNEAGISWDENVISP